MIGGYANNALNRFARELSADILGAAGAAIRTDEFEADAPAKDIVGRFDAWRLAHVIKQYG